MCQVMAWQKLKQIQKVIENEMQQVLSKNPVI